VAYPSDTDSGVDLARRGDTDVELGLRLDGRGDARRVANPSSALVRWQRFLRRQHTSEGVTWHIVHRSFADFLSDQPGVDLIRAHRRIADRLLAGWGTLAKSLPELPQDGRFIAAQAYALRHVAEHLRRAGQDVLLQDLVYHRRWYRARMAGDPTGNAYRSDLRHLWAAVRARNLASTNQRDARTDAVKDLECAFSTASLNATGTGSFYPLARATLGS
jgi:hypothetical protein